MNLYTHCFCSLTGGSLKTYTFRGEAKALAYCDNIKPYVTKKSESFLVEKVAPPIEQVSGCKLLRNPSSDKCQIHYKCRIPFLDEDIHRNKNVSI